MQRALTRPPSLVGLFAALTLLTAAALIWWRVPAYLADMLGIAFLAHALATLADGRFGAARTATWLMAVLAWLLVNAIGLLGALMPMGQMSYWAATVVTNIAAAIPVVGDRLVSWLWSGGSVSAPSADALLGLALLLLAVDAAVFHWGAWRGRSRWRGAAFATVAVLLGVACAYPVATPAPPDPFSPVSILPSVTELAPYAMLRAGPTKGMGLLLAAGSIVAWALLPWLRVSRLRVAGPAWLWPGACGGIVALWAALTWAGTLRPEGGVVVLSRVLAGAYFAWFAIVFVLGRVARRPPSAETVAEIF